MATPKVSISCITYNHASFLKDCFEGFLMQKTDFAFEILVHDDASTDGTTELIEEYTAKYPHLFFPIYQKENQYSKGMRSMMSHFNFPRARGEYIALCEGDDYWSDPHKLQLQIEEMQKHPDVDISFHPAYKLIDGKLESKLSNHVNHNTVFTMSEVILGGGGFCPTASLVFKSKIIKRIPNWVHSDAPVGDYFLQIFGAKTGGALYINKPMSVYRSGHAGSWVAGLKDSEKLKSYLKEMNLAMHKLCDDLEGQYFYDVNRAAAMMNYNVLKSQDFDLNYRKETYHSYQKYFTTKEVLMWHFVYSRFFLYKMIRAIKRFVPHLNKFK
jgi:glycosyltransferase involved in cell wall biosynthesis